MIKLQDEYAYIDTVEAEAQMSSQTPPATVTDNFSEERSFVTDDKNGDCDSASSSADCYQHFSSNLTRYKSSFHFVVIYFIIILIHG